MNKNFQTALLVVVAVVTGINTYMLVSSKGEADKPGAVAQMNKAAGLNSTPANTPATANPAAATADVPSGPTTTIAFAQESHDFGTIYQDSENRHVFSFTNTGSEPLVIESARGSCGCTVPSYPKEPIAPGATGEIEVIYKPGKQKASQNKTVTIVANTEPKNTVLNIKANVLEKAS